MQKDIMQELERFVREQLVLLLPPEKSWQPSELLPDLTKGGWEDDVRDLRAEAARLSDDVLVSLVGNMITEEALPSYHAWLATQDHGYGHTGVDENAFALWTRGWVAEEKRHGDAFSKYLYLCGRVNQRAVEDTLQNLIRRGFDPGTKNNPALSYVYTSFQEKATQISHANVAALARSQGAPRLAALCDAVAGDEARHERAYSRFVGRLMELDPDGTLLAFETMMRSAIIMPSERMHDGKDDRMYEWFKVVSHRSGMYTAKHYADIIDKLVKKWGVPALSPLTDAGRVAQEFLCKLAERMMKLAERIEKRPPVMPDRPISWIHGRSLAY